MSYVTTIRGAASLAVFRVPLGASVSAVTVDSVAATYTVDANGAIGVSSPVVNVNSVIDVTISSVTLKGPYGSGGGGVSYSPFSQTLLNAVVAAGAGSSFSYPGGPSTLNVTGSNFNGAIVTFEQSTDGGTTWSTVPGDKSSFFQADGCYVNGIAAGVLVRCKVTGTPGAAITAVLSR